MRKGGLRTAIGAIASTAVVLVAVLTALISIHEYQSLYRDYAAGELDALSENLSSDLIPTLAESPDMFQMTAILLRLDQYQTVQLAVVLDRDKALITNYLGQAARASAAEPSPDSLEEDQALLIRRASQMTPGVARFNNQIVSVKRVGDSRLPLGYLAISIDVTKSVNSSTRRLIVSVLPVLLIAVLVVVSLLMLLLRRLFKPLHSLSEFANRISATGDYSLQTQIQGTREIGDLTRNFNTMMRNINEEVEKNRLQNLQLRSQQDKMERLANYDSLTGLNNRQFVMDALRRELAWARREGVDFGVLFLDLDGFKAVNDSYGHEIGDKLLEAIGRDLKRETRDEDLIARLGGDEFLIVLDHCPDQDTAKQTAQRLIDTVAVPRTFDRWSVHVGASMGIASARAADYDISKLMIHADVAMYDAKVKGKGRFSIFVEKMADEEQRRLRIATAIIPAIERDELSLHYQPKVDAQARVRGFEALLRWPQSPLGRLMPDEFIPIAERGGHIHRLTRWVLDRAAQDLSVLKQAAGSSVSVAVNLSVYDLRDEALVDEVASVIAKYGLSPRDLELEITETAYLDSFEIANESVNRLRKLGCSITLDDFGTGYSSLSYLSRIQINTLKIDRQFIERVGESDRDSLLTRTIIEMADQLGLTTVAEGVETEHQASFLKANGCDLLQGYLYGKPISLDDVQQRFGQASDTLPVKQGNPSSQELFRAIDHR